MGRSAGRYSNGERVRRPVLIPGPWSIRLTLNGMTIVSARAAHRLRIIGDDLVWHPVSALLGQQTRKSRCVDEGQRLRLSGDMSLFRVTQPIVPMFMSGTWRGPRVDAALLVRHVCRPQCDATFRNRIGTASLGIWCWYCCRPPAPVDSVDFFDILSYSENRMGRIVAQFCVRNMTYAVDHVNCR